MKSVSLEKYGSISPMITVDKQSSLNTRLVFLDNSRYLMVMFVIVLHASAAYSNVIPWWHVLDSRKSPFFDITIVILDIFLMPVLFFIAGFFALPSLYKRGPSSFLVNKLKRLGIPLVLIGIFCAPIMPYIGYRGRTPYPAGFLEYWIKQMKTAVDFRFVHVNPSDMKTAAVYLDSFYQHHLWFISALLVFYSIFALTAAANNRLTKKAVGTGNVGRVTNSGSLLVAMFFAGLAISVLFALVNLLSRDGFWFKIGGLLLFQPTRVTIYAGLFALGIYAYSRDWFVRHPAPGASWLWLVLWLGLTLTFLVSIKYLYAVPTSFHRALALGFLRTFICLSSIGLLTSFAYRHWNHPTKINLSLAASSYDMYLIHMPIAVILQYLLLPLNIVAFIKFGLVSSVTLFMSWGISRYLIRHHPLMSVIVLLCAFALTAILL